jgi:endonuclease YncB( thermonuclease family)
MKRLAIVLCSILCAATAHAAELRGVATRIADGDTFTLRTGDREHSIRLCGIDSPERGEPGYAEASAVLRSLILGKAVHCRRVGEGTPCDGRSRATNRNRIVAQCFVTGFDVARVMISRKAACAWPRFSGDHYVTAGGCVRQSKT